MLPHTVQATPTQPRGTCQAVCIPAPAQARSPRRTRWWERAPGGWKATATSALRSRLLKGRLPFGILVACPFNSSQCPAQKEDSLPQEFRPVSRTNLQKEAFANDFL